MRVIWSLPVRGESIDSSRGDVVRARSLIQALRVDGHDVVVVSDAEAPGGRARVAAYRGMVRPLLPGALARIARDAGRIAHARLHARRLIAAARAQPADLIIETQVHFAGSGAVAARATRLPLVLDDCSPAAEEARLGAGLPGLARRVFLAQAAAAARLSVPTLTLRERLAREGAPESKIAIVPNGVDCAPHDATDRDRARHRLGVSDRVVIGFVGSFQPWHRAELLIDAVTRIAHLPVHVLLAGDGRGLAATLDRARTGGLAGRITAAGALDGAALADALAACDIGALPASNDYGQPMKLLDYAAARLPAVAPDIAPVREVLLDGRTGLLFPADDAVALAATLERLVRDSALRQRLGAEARTRVAEPATWARSARALIDRIGRPEAGHAGGHDEGKAA